MTATVFVDTETTGLDWDDEIWEFAAIRREPGVPTTKFHTFVRHSLARAWAMPDRFRIDHDTRYDASAALGHAELAEVLTRATFAPSLDGTKPHIIGAVPDFDTRRLSKILREQGHPDQPWHHHIIDVETYAVGWLAGRGVQIELPWNSNVLSSHLSIDPMDFDRHTAMGDAEWALTQWDVMHFVPPIQIVPAAAPPTTD